MITRTFCHHLIQIRLSVARIDQLVGKPFEYIAWRSNSSMSVRNFLWSNHQNFSVNLFSAKRIIYEESIKIRLDHQKPILWKAFPHLNQAYPGCFKIEEEIFELEIQVLINFSSERSILSNSTANKNVLTSAFAHRSFRSSKHFFLILAGNIGIAYCTGYGTRCKPSSLNI